MSTDVEVERCLSSLRELSSALVADLLLLPADAWVGETNCSPWLVRDLAAHIVESGQGFVGNIRRGLAGSVEPATAHGGRGDRYCLRVDGDTSACWLVTIDPERLDAQRCEAPADVTIAGSAAALALLAYGRRELRDLEQSGAIRVSGDQAVADRFETL